MKTVAFATFKKVPGFSEDDVFLSDALKNNGYKYQTIPWDTKGVDWSQFSIVVLRSMWDYCDRLNEFSEWLDELEKTGVNVWNPLPVVRWNMDKRYLFELEKKGVPIIPSMLLTKNSEHDVGKIFKDTRWGEIIFKPTTGLDGRGIFFGSGADKENLQSKLEALLTKSNVIVQPIMKSVLTEGEYSFVFINNVYSHTALKVQNSNELKIARRTGGVIVQRADPSVSFIEQAEDVFEKLDKKLLYARIDMVNIDGKLHAMETECIEPVLYFKLYPEATTKFVNAMDKLAS
ncbi:MAG: hypothetical protein AAB923_02860 [Patescibacteria group bacterium]